MVDPNPVYAFGKIRRDTRQHFVSNLHPALANYCLNGSTIDEARIDCVLKRQRTFLR